MGAKPRDYQRVAPPGSFIHVDAFASPQHLAQYLHLLDRNDTLYNAYFAWKVTLSTLAFRGNLIAGNWKIHKHQILVSNVCYAT